jgi:hypothetical protein
MSHGTHLDRSNDDALQSLAELHREFLEFKSVALERIGKALFQPGVSLAKGTAQNISSGADTLITYAASHIEDDDGGFFSDSDDGFVIPAGMEGWYHIRAQTNWESNSTQRRLTYIDINGSHQATNIVSVIGNSWAHEVNLIWKLAVGDTVTHEVHQASGVALDVTLARLQMTRA